MGRSYVSKLHTSAPPPDHDPVVFDQALAVGQRVSVRWTAQGFAYEGEGVITTLTPRMVAVRLAADCPGPFLPPTPQLDAHTLLEYYEQGHVITVPRYRYARWSINRCVAPVRWSGGVRTEGPAG